MGKRHGKGGYYYSDGGSYVGDWLDDRIQGKGVSHYSNGNMYEGDWVDGKIEGVGTLTYTDGDRYVGSWSDGQMHGTGTYYYASGDVYEGEWRADKRHGRGTVTYTNPNGEPTERYEGDWSEGKMHGFGRYEYADGGIYEGSWVDSKMHGKGTYTFANGNVYEGEWSNDAKHGFGILQYVNGERYEVSLLLSPPTSSSLREFLVLVVAVFYRYSTFEGLSFLPSRTKVCLFCFCFGSFPSSLPPSLFLPRPPLFLRGSCGSPPGNPPPQPRTTSPPSNPTGKLEKRPCARRGHPYLRQGRRVSGRVEGRCEEWAGRIKV